jgi:DNA-binding LytR/AlgR family response regulator
VNELSILVVEDNVHARDALLRLLASHADIGDVTTAGTLAEAREEALILRRDVVFLDVRLPDGEGTTLGAELSSGSARPALVYLTADPAPAVEAFRQGAVDYLLKPVSPTDLARALDRVRAMLRGAPPAPLAIREGATTRFVAIDLIAAIETAGHYQCVHAAGEVHLIRQTTAALLARLGPGFIRVHRSTVVRTGLVSRMESARNGDGELVLVGGRRVRFSRVYRKDLEAALTRVLHR